MTNTNIINKSYNEKSINEYNYKENRQINNIDNIFKTKITHKKILFPSDIFTNTDDTSTDFTVNLEPSDDHYENSLMHDETKLNTSIYNARKSFKNNFETNNSDNDNYYKYDIFDFTRPNSPEDDYKISYEM